MEEAATNNEPTEAPTSLLFEFDDSLEGINFDELQTEIEKDAKRGRFIDEPGVYTLKVDRVEIMEIKEPKPNWSAVKVYLKDIDGRETNEMLFIPTTNDVKYPTNSGKNQLWAIIKLQKFATSIGIDMQGKQLFVGIQKMFGNLTSLVGRTGRYRLDFETANHAEPVGEGWVLVLSGKPVMREDDPTEVQEFPKKSDAELYCTQIARKKFSAFLSIVEYMQGEVVEKTEKAGKILGLG